MNYRNMHIEYNSFHENHKKPFGAIRIGEDVRLSLHVEGAIHIDVTLVLMKEGAREQYYKMTPKDHEFHALVTTSNEPGLYFYYFIINYSDNNTNNIIYLTSTDQGYGGEGKVVENRWDVIPYQITLHNYVDASPKWYKEAVFYQIFVDRFHNGNEDRRVLNPKKNSFLYSTWEDTPMYIKDKDGNIVRWDFFGGNLLGVIKKLDYLQKLGIGGIYLNPIFKARSNHKYDTGDYMTIDEMFGDEETFKKLINEAEKRGIRIVLDGVFNHVGADSIYFNAYGNYKELGAAQSKDSRFYPWFNFFYYPYDYECWWGVKDLPNVNEHNDAYRDFIVGKNGVIEKWTKLGIGGWRLDVADEMPDEFIRDIRRTMDGVSKDAVLIGEVWEDASNKIAYGKRREYLLGDEIHGTMNYPFKESVMGYIKGTMKAGEVYLKMMSLKENYPTEAFYSALNNLGTHDTKRIFTEIDNFDQLKIAIGLLMTFPGVPCIYYGDEAGVKGEADPFNRGPYPWGKENERIMEFYKTMIDMRKSSVVFTQGDFIPFYQENIFGFLRILEEEAVIVIVNRDLEDFRLLLEDTVGLESIADRYKHILSGEFHLKKTSINIYKL